MSEANRPLIGNVKQSCGLIQIVFDHDTVLNDTNSSVQTVIEFFPLKSPIDNQAFTLLPLSF